MPTLFPVNCYLVEETNSLTLIDTALPYSYKAILKTAQQIGKPITQIILTHAHNDHLGSLDTLKEKLPQAEVIISKREAKILQGNHDLEINEPAFPLRGGIPTHIKTIPDRLLEDGHKVGSLQAIAAPGHTPGLMTFMDIRNNFIIVGDAFQTRPSLTIAGQIKWLFPFPALATWHKQLALESAKKLCAMKPTLLAAGHGPALIDPLTALDLSIQQAEQALKKR